MVVGSLSAQNLDPGTTLKTDSTKRIVSANLSTTDIVGLDTAIGTLQSRSVALETKTQGLDWNLGTLESNSDIDLVSTRALKRARLVETDQITDPTAASSINISATNIDLTATNITANGADVGLLAARTVNISSATVGVDTQFDADVDVGQNLNATTLSEGNVQGELLKIKAAGTYYAGLGAGFALTTAVDVMFLGDNAGSSSSGNGNIAIGARAAQGNSTHTGANNTSIGTDSLLLVEGEAKNNTCIGAFSGGGITTGSQNVCVGNGTATNSSFATVVGRGASANYDNSTSIGNLCSTTKANQIALGNGSVIEIVPKSSGLCDLGTATYSWKNIQCSTINGQTFNAPQSGAFMYHGSSLIDTQENDTIHKALFTSTNLNSGAVDFTHQSPNRLTYTGTSTKTFFASCFLSAKPDTGVNTPFVFFLYKNGLPCEGLLNDLILDTAAKHEQTSFSGTLSLSTNDYVELWIQQGLPGCDITIDRLGLTLLANTY